MWIRLPLRCFQRKSNRPVVRFIISSVNSAAVSAGDMAIYPSFFTDPAQQGSRQISQLAEKAKESLSHEFISKQTHVLFSCTKEGKKLNKGPILFIFKFDLGITRSLPTHIADVSMGFVAGSLDASIWKETEGWRRAWVSIVCSSLRIRSPVW